MIIQSKRIIKNTSFWAGGQCAPDDDFLLVAARQAAGRLVLPGNLDAKIIHVLWVISAFSLHLAEFCCLWSSRPEVVFAATSLILEMFPVEYDPPAQQSMHRRRGLFRGQGPVMSAPSRMALPPSTYPAKNGGGKPGAACTHDPGDPQDLTRVNLKVNVAEAVAGIVLQFKYRVYA